LDKTQKKVQLDNKLFSLSLFLDSAI